MTRNDMRLKRGILCIVSGLMITIMILSVIYTAREADHECSGAHCPICAVIRQCEAPVYMSASSVPSGVHAAVPVVIRRFNTVMNPHIFTADTLISAKIRIND